MFFPVYHFNGMGSKKEEILRFIQENPGHSMPDIAQLFGVTRSYIQQLVKNYGLYDHIHLLKRRHTCIVCGAPIPATGRKYCPSCSPRKPVHLTCYRCGKEFTLPQRTYDLKVAKGQKKWFCSNDCRLAWMREALG